MLNKSLVAALLSGAIAIAGSAWAQGVPSGGVGGAIGGAGVVGTTPDKSTGAPSTNMPAAPAGANSSTSNTTTSQAGGDTGNVQSSSNAGTSSGASIGSSATAQNPSASASSNATLGGSANAQKPSASASGAASANANAGTGAVFAGLNLGKTATPAKGLTKAAMARVDADEKRITSELNRASASSTGNAPGGTQASIPSTQGAEIQ